MTDLHEPEKTCMNCLDRDKQGDELPCIRCGPAKEGWRQRPL